MLRSGRPTNTLDTVVKMSEIQEKKSHFYANKCIFEIPFSKNSNPSNQDFLNFYPFFRFFWIFLTHCLPYPVY